MAVNTTVSNIPTPPKRGVDSQTTFVIKGEAVFDALHDTVIGQMNTAFGEINTTEANINAKEASVVAKEASISPHYAAIDAVNANKSNIDIVAANNANITAVADNEANINAVNANKTNIDAVAGNEVNITSVATNKTNIDAVADNETNINAVATNNTNITAVADNETNINAVATQIVPNLPEILLADDNAIIATTKASEASTSATLAQNWATSETLVDGINKGAKGYALEAQEAVATLPEGTLNDSQTTLTNTWSAEKIINELQGLDVSPIVAPTITSPLDGAVDFLGEITSTYTTSSSYAGTQDWVRWEASTLADFSTLVDSYEGGSNLTTWTPNVGELDMTTVYVRTKQGSDGHRSVWSAVISFTTPDIFIETPTLTVTGTPTDVPENPILTTSAFSVVNGSDTHTSTTFTVKDGLGVVVWTETKTTGDLLTTGVPAGILAVSTAYTFEAFHTGATYGNSGTVIVSGTTISEFPTYSAAQGQKGFSVAPANYDVSYLGLTELTGTKDPNSDQYGNYIQLATGSIMCHIPKHFTRVGHPDSPRFAVYGSQAIDVVFEDIFANEAEANAAGYAMPRAFIDGGLEKGGYFIDKYKASKMATDANRSCSVQNGIPISLATTAGYTVSNGMTGCTGILADAVTLSRARGDGYNCASAFMYGNLFILSVAQAQATTSTDDTAWYDISGTTNFPKGCNNNALGDVDDAGVSYTTAGDIGNANKPLTGSGVPFAKTTHNGANNGVADLNGGMNEPALGVTNIGTSATSTAQITTNTIYVLKQSVKLADLTQGWGGATDAWDNAANLSTRYDAVTSPVTLSTAENVRWGNGTAQVFSNTTTGVARDLAGFSGNSNASFSSTGTNLYGDDYFIKYNIHNMFVRCCGYWYYAANAGLGSRSWSSFRSSGYTGDGFRSCAYVA